MGIDLTDKDRLLLANQYEILALLKSDEGYALVADALRSGHKWIYDQHIDSELSETLPANKVEHVLNILNIFGSLKDSYRNLPDKTGIDEKNLLFPGFDGNNESELLIFSQALTKNGRYKLTIGDSATNSHFPTTEMYTRMIKRWNELGAPNYPYSKETIQEILAARMHPHSR